MNSTLVNTQLRCQRKGVMGEPCNGRLLSDYGELACMSCGAVHESDGTYITPHVMTGNLKKGQAKSRKKLIRN